MNDEKQITPESDSTLLQYLMGRRDFIKVGSTLFALFAAGLGVNEFLKYSDRKQLAESLKRDAEREKILAKLAIQEKPGEGMEEPVFGYFHSPMHIEKGKYATLATIDTKGPKLFCVYDKANPENPSWGMVDESDVREAGKDPSTVETYKNPKIRLDALGVYHPKVMEHMKDATKIYVLYENNNPTKLDVVGSDGRQVIVHSNGEIEVAKRIPSASAILRELDKMEKRVGPRGLSNVK